MRSARASSAAPPPGAVKSPDSGDKPPAKSQIRLAFDLVVSLGGALLAAFAVKWMILDIYKIPSGSMEPALHGRTDGGDRVLCLKSAYRFRDPLRWEMAVFDFPYESAIRRRGAVPQAGDARRELAPHKDAIFIKRVIGLPKETVAIARGDLWVKKDGVEPFVRPEKSDHYQRNLWIPVHEEDFADLASDELPIWWTASGAGDWRIEDHALVARPGPDDAARLAYRPRMRFRADRIDDLDGVPDRYTLRQPVRFHCRPGALHPYEPDPPQAAIVRRPGCGKQVIKTIRNTQVAARCPGCGAYLLEDAAEFHHRRSGLPLPNIAPFVPRQGELQRSAVMHFVGDLRLRARARLSGAARAAFVFSDDGRVTTLSWTAAGGGRVAAVQTDPDGRTRILAEAPAPVPTGTWFEVEGYVADGRARLFLAGRAEAALDVAFAGDAKPPPDSAPSRTGAALEASGGEVAWRHVRLDRDVFYFNGLEKPPRAGWPADLSPAPLLRDRGEIRLGEDDYLFFGDNAPDSLDGRAFGPVARSLLYGPAVWLWWPPYRAHALP